jgi:hypothetical protein
MENQMAPKDQNKQLANPEDLSAWGGGQALTSKDILIGKILPMNFMSEKVKEEKAKYGEFRDTVFNKKFGDLKTPFEFVPIYMEKKWIEFDVIANKAGARKREYKQIIPIVDNPTAAGYNDDLPYVDPEHNIERDRCMDFYVLIPEEIKTGEAIPYILSFRRTSIKAGQKLAMQMFQRNAKAGLPPAAVTMKLSGKTVQNDEGEFVVMDVESARKTEKAEMQDAFEWYKLITAGKTKVDTSDYQEEAKARSGGKPIDVSEGDY